MGCFLVPKMVCREIEKEAARFFWSSTNENQKIQWIAWRSKAEGGMGFRDLHCFNLALVAKQVWRIKQDPHSLVAKILKGKYFPNNDILDAAISYRPSQVWRSLHKAAAIIKEGMSWRVGNGEKIIIGQDKWIGNIDTRAPELPGDHEFSCKKVSSLLLPGSKKWNSDLIKEVFNENDSEKILAIPLGINQQEDLITWRHSNTG